MCRTRKKNWFLSKNARRIDITACWLYNSYTSKRYAPFGALQVSGLWDLTARWCWKHQVADTVYQRADACRHWLFLFSVIKNTMENRKCQLQTWKVEKYSGNLCAARTGRRVLGRRRRLAAEVPCPRRGKNAAARRPGGAGVHRREQKGDKTPYGFLLRILKHFRFQQSYGFWNL